MSARNRQFGYTRRSPTIAPSFSGADPGGRILKPAMEVIKGIPVSPGVVIGRAFLLGQTLESVSYSSINAEDVPRELARLDEAVRQASDDLKADRDRAAEKLGEEPARIFEFHLTLLHDPSLMEPVRRGIAEKLVTAEYAVSDAFRSLARRFRSMGSDVFRQKAADVIDIDRRLLDKLIGGSQDRLDEITEPVVVIAHDLTPAQAASIDTSRVMAFAIDAGGRTSHTSIFAAALGIPVVVGCRSLTSYVSEGDRVIIDGRRGMVIVRPDEETLEKSQARVQEHADSKARLKELAELEPVTQDGDADRTAVPTSNSPVRSPTCTPTAATASGSSARNSSISRAGPNPRRRSTTTSIGARSRCSTASR
jgi:phosphotransferase system enzyme I (PtsI)